MNESHPSLSRSLSDNERRLRDIFSNCGDIEIAPFRFNERFRDSALVAYCKPLTQDLQHNYLETIFREIVPEQSSEHISTERVVSYIQHHGPTIQPIQFLDHLDQVTAGILEGRFVILFDRWDKAISFDAYSVQRRQVEEPKSETVINGPREGMIEDLQKNIGLLRIRLKSPKFKIEQYEAGKHAKTKYIVGYLEHRVDPDVLNELKRRVVRINEADLLDTSYIREYLEERVYSPFPQLRITERPDVAVSALLEGKIILMLDGSSTILVCPTMFSELFQSAEDYYQRTVFSSLIRVLRIVSFFIALTLPSLYIALSTFHTELIPTTLLLTILDTREGIPFPSFAEAFIMQFFFELMREAGIRLPRPVGSTISIVGALIIGEASIRAGIASPFMVVVIALTGIASFSLPQYEMAVALRVLVFPMMILAALLGGFGLMIGFILIFLHITSLRSLGRPFFSPFAPLKMFQLLDVVVRAPLNLRMKSARRQTSDR